MYVCFKYNGNHQELHRLPNSFTTRRASVLLDRQVHAFFVRAQEGGLRLVAVQFAYLDDILSRNNGACHGQGCRACQFCIKLVGVHIGSCAEPPEGKSEINCTQYRAEIGRASCRERVGQSVEIRVVDESLKKKKTT